MQAGDAVLVRAMNRTSGQFCWAPGVVEGLEMPPVPQATPSQKLARQKPTADPKQIKYSVRLYSGEMVRFFLFHVSVQ